MFHPPNTKFVRAKVPLFVATVPVNGLVALDTVAGAVPEVAPFEKYLTCNFQIAYMT